LQNLSLLQNTETFNTNTKRFNSEETILLNHILNRLNRPKNEEIVKLFINNTILVHDKIVVFRIIVSKTHTNN